MHQKWAHFLILFTTIPCVMPDGRAAFLQVRKSQKFELTVLTTDFGSICPCGHLVLARHTTLAVYQHSFIQKQREVQCVWL